jgi:uncharacterized RDD family membrane protein YckC
MSEHELVPRRFAEWHERFLAYLLDVGPLVVLFFVLVAFTDDSGSYLRIGFEALRTTGPDGQSFGYSFLISGMPSVIYVVVMLSWFAYNWLLRQGKTGQTYGKKVMEIAVLDLATGRPSGPALIFARQVTHVLDFVPCFLGYLWSAWDRESRTFADMIVGTRVYRVGPGRV